jgi:catechol-2,3-dioxygenase
MPSINPPSFFQVWNQGMLHHMAYKCDSLEQLHKLRQQIKDYGVPVSKIVNHGFCHSCYFTDPSGYNLELACTVRGYTDDEYDITILDRKLRDDENVHEESDTHGKNVIKPKL